MVVVDALKQYVDSIFRLLQIVFQDQNRSEALLRSSMGVIGYSNHRHICRTRLTIFLATWRKPFQTVNMPRFTVKTGSLLW